MKFFSVIAFMSICVYMVNSSCTSTYWQIYVGGKTIGHQFLIAIPDNKKSAKAFGKGQCMRAELFKDDNKLFGGTTSHHSRASNSCSDDKMRLQMSICADESVFETAKLASIKYESDKKTPKKYNVATNNCQQFAGRMVTALNSHKVK